MTEVRDQTFKPGLSACIEEKLEEYFKALGDSLPSSNLYTVIIEEVEKPLLKLALLKVDGNQVRASEMLGLNRNTLRKKLIHYNIDPHALKNDSI